MTDTLMIDRPITGDIQQYTTIARRVQLGAADFLAAIDTVLAIDGVEAIRWAQYTPYFNDGDSCEFGIYFHGVKLSDRFEVDEDDGDYGGGFLTSSELFPYGDLGEVPAYRVSTDGTPATGYGYGDGSVENPAYAVWTAAFYAESNRSKVINGHPTDDIYDAVWQLDGSIDSFQDVLRANFGDPAEVTATAAGFDVEEYDHD